MKPVIALFLVLGAAAFSADTAPADLACGMPQQAADGWRIEQDAPAAGFDAELLCEAAQDFLQSPRNLHGFVVERHGQLVLEAYRAGPDRSTYSLWASRTAFDQDTRHDVRSVTKSIVALLWGIAESEGAVPPLSTPVLDLLPALADLRDGGRERITVADMLCMRSGLAWDESGSYSRWHNDEKDLLWRGDRARYVFERRASTSPGTHFNDNGGLTAVLGLLLEEKTRQDLAKFARQRLFEPLGFQPWEWVATTLAHAGEPAGTPAPAAAAVGQAGPVETRATVRSITEEDGGKRMFVHLKLAPASNLPFTTLRFRVREPALVAGLHAGASVKFRAERIDGENTLVAIRSVPACVRFQPCD